MTATATRKEGLPESYYAPEFAIEIEGEELDPASKGDVLELKIEMTFNEMTSAEVKLNNFDDTAYDLKWSDAEKLRLGSRVHVKLGYADRTRSMMRGYISTLTPEFADGPPTLTVRALDGMVRLKSSKPPAEEVTYKKVTDSQIAQKIAQRHNLRVKVTDEGPVHDLVVQRNTDDATFLKERAKLHSFEVFMRTDPDTGEDVLHFVSPTDGRGSEPISTYTLAWGGMRNTDIPPSLIEFKPVLAAGDQVQSVTVRGWDPKTKKKITQTATRANTPGVAQIDNTNGPEAAATMGGTSEAKREVVVDRPVASEEEALKVAQAILSERAYRFLTGHGKVIGLPDLRPGTNVEIGGVGRRFSGTYFVTKVTHVLNQQGFLTEFDVSRRI
jgi:phage protein D